MEVMLDLESMGVGNDPALIQIAAIAFNPLTGEELSSFDEKIDLKSSMDSGLKITAGTIKFWMTHESVNQDARNIVMSETGDHGKTGQTLNTVLDKFSKWYKSLDCTGVWGNGAASDNVWLRSAYDAIKQPYPFIFRDDLCLRTLKSIAKQKGYITNFEFVGNQHDGLDDCRYQIKDLIEIKKFLNI
ncbi:exonuclease [Vibrio phage PWH3a-P1]|uniref:exonuclease n=1 Tax=Vibrio phage PWH3a-P1 TaxID=754058 RepID=UPI0002C12726|nr:exonuclease [Vibrio phage PWH3a-P1]AGH31970.1 exonuclease [Vibrio phage PWH3a-P1]